MSPPPENGTITQCTFTEPQKAFVGPHHGPKFWGKNSQSTTKVTLTSHQWHPRIVGWQDYSHSESPTQNTKINQIISPGKFWTRHWIMTQAVKYGQHFEFEDEEISSRTFGYIETNINIHLITARIRRMGEGNSFSLSTPRGGGGGYLPWPGADRGRGYPEVGIPPQPGQDGGRRGTPR